MKIKNAGGKIYYGMHFYPGVAEYAEAGKTPFRIFINEDTIRDMGPTFAAKPIFVDHVDEVADDIDDLKHDVDGYVVESFFNKSDGKHWVKMIITSKRAEHAIQRGYRLSNAYIPKGAYGPEGVWNGVSYDKQILGGEYEHLAIVKNPRYEESVIMTPEQFKNYNIEKEQELMRIANSKDKETTEMKINFFKKTKVENSKELDLESLSLTLPKTGKEMTVTQLVNAMDEMEEKMKKNEAEPGMMVKLHDGTMCNVGELVEKHKALHDEVMKYKSDMEMEGDLKPEVEPVEVEGDLANEEEKPEEKKDEKKKENEEEKKDDEKKKNEADEKKKNFEALKNAHLKNQSKPEEKTFELPADQIARGKQRYGSAN